jgi:hypothetical protein
VSFKEVDSIKEAGGAGAVGWPGTLDVAQHKGERLILGLFVLVVNVSAGNSDDFTGSTHERPCTFILLKSFSSAPCF